MNRPTQDSLPPDVAPALAAFQSATSAAQTGLPEGLAGAVVQCQRAIDLLHPLTPNASPALHRLLASIWILKGNSLRDQGTTASRAAALPAYDEAIGLLEKLIHRHSDHNNLNYLGNAWTNRGICLLNENTPATLKEAIQCFDRANEVRNSLPILQNPWFCYDFVAGWLNRGDALTRLGGHTNLALAVAAFDTALLHLRHLALKEHPLFRQRMAITWMNRGTTLMAQGTAISLADALHSFAESVSEIEAMPESEQAQNAVLLGCAWMNRGNVLHRLAPARAAEVRQAELRALALLAGPAREQILAAEADLKARHILCQAIGHLLTTKEFPPGIGADLLVTEATDTVEAGLALARQWEERGTKNFREPARELFRFGSRVYQLHQPHFLVEFLIENLDPAKTGGTLVGGMEMHLVAAEALWHGLRDLQKTGFKSVNTPQFEPLLERLRDLRVAESRLAELREKWKLLNQS